jgi:hypothetical protein
MFLSEHVIRNEAFFSDRFAAMAGGNERRTLFETTLQGFLSAAGKGLQKFPGI